ncbi:hypothetical protein SAY86_022086 [Trapa natans]|uniref:Peroxidase n=1 Tax=Trapa natans TaxID=22666 RepID=A0AAN7MAU4_TRANT|nr:hypothetical protein SAY86_022086 [Trapa natans]
MGASQLALVMGLFAAIVVVGAQVPGGLHVGFYSRSCPAAESIVRDAVKAAVAADLRNAAVLLRVHFHDCFVEGCDASILIDSGDTSERLAKGHEGVGGFDIIEGAKAQLEQACPGVVSCADILALAARDAVLLSDGPFYEVPTGRRDGLFSSVSLAGDMPEVNDSIEQLKSKFKLKGLSDRDLVLLSGGAHTIGTTACFFMGERLYNFRSTGGSDPAINPNFLPNLTATCPNGGDVNKRLPLDPMTEFTFDAQIFRNIKDGFAVISSDARLYDDAGTRSVVDFYVGGDDIGTGSGRTSSSLFGRDFAKAMVKMGQIGVKTGWEGEIRRVCKSFN